MSKRLSNRSPRMLSESRELDVDSSLALFAEIGALSDCVGSLTDETGAGAG